jgi:phage terminase Nu1 subunit (DNA packaging protein)
VGTAEATVTKATLAKLLQLSDANVGRLATQGILVRQGYDKFELWGSIRGYITHLHSRIRERKTPAHTLGLADEKIRKTKEEADRVSMDNAERRRALAPVPLLARALGNVFEPMRERIMASELSDEDKDGLLVDLQRILNLEALTYESSGDGGGAAAERAAGGGGAAGGDGAPVRGTVPRTAAPA